MGLEGLQLLTQWFQNIGLLLKQNIKLPEFFDFIKGIYNTFLTLEFDIPGLDAIKNIQRFTRIDYRIQFMVFNIGIPIGLTMISMILFKEFYVIVWYFSVLSSIIIIITGIIASFLYTEIPVMNEINFTIPYLGIDVSLTPNLLLIIIGLIILVICILLFGCCYTISFCRKRKRKKKKIREIELNDFRKRKEKEGTNIVKASTVTFLNGQIIINPLVQQKTTSSAPRIGQSDSFKIEALELNELRLEREQKLKFNKCRVFKFIVYTILFLIGALFLTQVLKFEYMGWKDEEMCETDSCCNFLDCIVFLRRNIPLYIRNPLKAKWLRNRKKRIHPITSESRTNADYAKHPPSYYIFEKPGTHGIPPAELGKISKMELPEKKKKLQKEKWKIRTILSKNPIRSLYFSYTYRWRYFQIFLTLLKVLLVAFSTLLFMYPLFSIPASLAIHSVTLIFFFITLPYIDLAEDFLCLLISVTTTLTCTYLIFPTFEISLPDYIPVIIMILNGAVIPLSIIQIFYSCCRRNVHEKKFKRLLKKLEDLQEEGVINVQEKVDYQSYRKKMKDTDEIITNSTLKIVLGFLMIIGICSFLSLSSSILGLLVGELQPKTIQTNSQFLEQTGLSCKDINTIEFGKYTSWNNFTSNCCCERVQYYESSILYSHWYDVELWSCKNGEKKERVRTEFRNNVYLNTTNLFRDFCSKTFNPPFTLVNIDETAECSFHTISGGDDELTSFGNNFTKIYVRKALW